MDADDRFAEYEDDKLDRYMEREHSAGRHDAEPDPDCWVCQQATPEEGDTK